MEQFAESSFYKKPDCEHFIKMQSKLQTTGAHSTVQNI